MTIWVSLVHVKPISPESPLSKRAKGGYTNAIAFANGPAEFQRKVTRKLKTIGLKAIEFEDEETLENRREKWEVPDELAELADSLTDPAEVRFTEFSGYLSDDEVQ